MHDNTITAAGNIILSLLFVFFMALTIRIAGSVHLYSKSTDTGWEKQEVQVMRRGRSILYWYDISYGYNYAQWTRVYSAEPRNIRRCVSETESAEYTEIIIEPGSGELIDRYGNMEQTTEMYSLFILADITTAVILCVWVRYYIQNNTPSGGME